MDTDDYDYPDPPEADPAIRLTYQQALGRLILAHNEVDYWLAAILAKAARDIAPDGSLDRIALGSFADRARMLDLLMKTSEISFGGIGNGRLIELNDYRNTLAHGHFNQDPYYGSYEIIERRFQSQRARVRKDFTAERINELADELERIAGHMRAVDAFWDSMPKGYSISEVVL